MISIDNGYSFVEPDVALARYGMETLASYMDDDVREDVYGDLAPCTDLEFLAEYLKRAKENLVLG